MEIERSPFFLTNKPYVRWWWFNQPIEAPDITTQLDWVFRQGFGGVEIAWVYPLPGRAAGPRWLSPEWSARATQAKEACRQRGLGCDFTFGSLWPFGDSSLVGPETSQWFSGPSPQRIDRHWETRERSGGPAVMNHLDRRALDAYARRMGPALAPALAGEPSCLFCDSWEVEEEGRLWAEGFESRFLDRYGYRIEPFMPALAEHPRERYDYRVLVGELVREEFYRPFADHCRSLGAVSRVQCHGAPTDIVAAYAEADVPESEALLFDPEFSRFAASAAALRGKEIVSCEAFTCLYGWNPWPAESPYLGQEKMGDVKLLADALAAHGVNRFVWHGMPYNAPGGTDRFYASVHVGPDGSLAPGISAMNGYLEELSRHLREGAAVFGVALLVPLADVRMKGELPAGLRKPSARSWWELQHRCLPEELTPWSPLWVTGAFLRDAESLPDGSLRVGEVTVPALVVDVEYLDASTAAHLARLSASGGRIVLTRAPREPGRATSRDFAGLAGSIATGRRARISADLRSSLREVPPILQSGSGLDFFVRSVERDLLLFVAHPGSSRLTYPMAYGASEKAVAETRRGRLAVPGGPEIDCELPFGRQASILLRVSRRGSVDRVRLPSI